MTAQDFSDQAEADQQEILEQLGEDGAQHRRFILSRAAKHRLDKFLQNRLKGLSRNQVQKLIGLGGVRVNDKPAKASLKLAEGDLIRGESLDLPEPLEIGTGAAGESNEGRRVTASGTTVGSPSALADGLGVTVDDGSGDEGLPLTHPGDEGAGGK